MDQLFESQKLDDSQLETFDHDDLDDDTWGFVRARIDSTFGTGQFRFLDVGGGNGGFADRLLDAYPESTGTVLDASDMLLSRNRPHERKTLIASPVEAAHASIEGDYDLICFNWLLHHLVGRSYRATLRNMRSALCVCSKWLTPRGRISILENVYNGRVLDALPSRLIFEVTSAKSLVAVARKMGANTAGVGVCFLSQRQWKRLLSRAGLCVVQCAEDAPHRVHSRNKALLLLEDVRTAHFWCRPVAGASQRPGG